MRTRLFSAAAGCLAALTAGCGNDSPAPAAAPSAAAQPAVVQNPLPAADKIKNDAAKRKNVTVTQCAASDGGWSATGTAANPGKEKADYTITVFFTTESATVVDYAETKVTVEPGKTADWKAAKQFTAPAKTLCVLRAVG